MSNTGIGRLLVASLHEAIGDELPTRIDFYEHWLQPDRFRQGSFGLAPMSAVVGFLRTEGAAYHRIVRRAGTSAADWVFLDANPAAARLRRAVPAWLGTRLVLRAARAAFRRTWSGTGLRWSVRRGAGRIELTGSLFCDTRIDDRQPRCGYYAAAIERLLALHGVPGVVGIASCRAAGGSRCIIELKRADPAAPESSL